MKNIVGINMTTAAKEALVGIAILAGLSLAVLYCVYTAGYYKGFNARPKQEFTEYDRQLLQEACRNIAESK